MQSYVFLQNLQRPVLLNTARTKKAHLKAVIFGVSYGHVADACSVSVAFSLQTFLCIYYFFGNFQGSLSPGCAS